MFIFRILLGGCQNYMIDPAIVDFMKNAKFYEFGVFGTNGNFRG